MMPAPSTPPELCTPACLDLINAVNVSSCLASGALDGVLSPVRAVGFEQLSSACEVAACSVAIGPVLTNATACVTEVLPVVGEVFAGNATSCPATCIAALEALEGECSEMLGATEVVSGMLEAVQGTLCAPE